MSSSLTIINFKQQTHLPGEENESMGGRIRNLPGRLFNKIYSWTEAMFIGEIGAQTNGYAAGNEQNREIVTGTILEWDLKQSLAVVFLTDFHIITDTITPTPLKRFFKKVKKIAYIYFYIDEVSEQELKNHLRNNVKTDYNSIDNEILNHNRIGYHASPGFKGSHIFKGFINKWKYIFNIIPNVIIDLKPGIKFYHRAGISLILFVLCLSDKRCRIRGPDQAKINRPKFVCQRI